ncbi:unnamed protein product [Triticum turgidum subsp. durum]|uniref:Uncharacterized protein n=1 Tax=Triticum turgidum subsp. durum TaxID=4567 RepID=A0A9R0UZ79_TRITD|nr:unnamed protein product [Triticum turgidum subsp. durum]
MGAKKSEWWAVDGELHEIGEGVPHRERFAIPRDNLPNRRRKQMREQFMRRTRLVLKDSEHETWCKKYMELYQELRENWERLYWDEGYSKKIAEDRANYDSAEEDDLDFSPYRLAPKALKAGSGKATSFCWECVGKPTRFCTCPGILIWHTSGASVGASVGPYNFLIVMRVIGKSDVELVHNKLDLGFGESKQGETWERVTQIRDKFEYDRERRMRERAFAPMNMENNFGQQNWKRPEARTSQGFPRQT